MVASEFGDALWPDAPSMHFDDCDIHGMTVHVFDAEVTGNYADRCIFTDCDFSDSYQGQAVSSPSVTYPWLINTECRTIDGQTFGCPMTLLQAGALEMTNCTLTTCGHLMPFRIYGGADPWHAILTDLTYHFEGNLNSEMQWGNLFWVNFTNFIVEYPSPPCSDPRNDEIVATFSNGLVNASWDIVDDPSSYTPPLCPPQYLDPNVPSLPLCIDCDSPLAEPCSGHPDPPNHCDPLYEYPCCTPCDCYLIEPVIPCEELHEDE